MSVEVAPPSSQSPKTQQTKLEALPRISWTTVLFASVITILGIIMLTAKITLFDGLSYLGDIFLHTQIAKSPYQGRGLFYDNVFSPNSYIHNYFILVLIGPIVMLFGSYALLLTHAFLHVLSASWVFLSTNLSRATLLGVFVVVLVLYYGPIALWIFDDPTYGWHSELLFFPLGVLFGLTLYQETRWKYLFGALLALNREDGPVIACSIHLLVELSSNFVNQKTVFSWPQLKRLLLITLFWVVVFGIGMLSLKVFAAPATGRQDKASKFALEVLENKAGLQGDLLSMLKGTALLLSPLLPFFLTGIRFRYLFTALLVALPTLMICMLASFAYLPKVQSMHYHGTSWPGRFCMLWAIGVSSILLGYFERIRFEKAHSLFFTLIFLASAASLYLQDYSLREVRGYEFYTRWIQPSVTPEVLNISGLRPRERRLLTCLRDEIPTNTTITFSRQLAGLYHNHDWVGGHRIDKAWKPPELFICDKGLRWRHISDCLEGMKHPVAESYTRFVFKDLSFAFDARIPEVRDAFKSCLPEKRRALVFKETS